MRTVSASNAPFSSTLQPQTLISQTPGTVQQIGQLVPQSGIGSIPNVVRHPISGQPQPRMLMTSPQIRMTSSNSVLPARGVALVSPMDDDIGVSNATPQRIITGTSSGTNLMMTHQSNPNIAHSTRVLTTSVLSQPGRVGSPQFTVVQRPMMGTPGGQGRSGSPLAVVQRGGLNSPNQVIRLVSNPSQPGQAPATR